MARKTYHHIAVGQIVPVQFTYWNSVGDQTITHHELATVTEVGTKTLKATVPVSVSWNPKAEIDGVTGSETLTLFTPETVTFSRQGGQEWGSSECGWRLDPSLAQSK